MAVSRLPTAALSLKQFLQRQKVLGVYRDLLRSIRKIPTESDRRYLRDWAREEFKRNKTETDQDVIRMMLTQAHNHLEDLRRSLALAGC
ncbi:LYR motif-containing protein 2 [Carassius auratus]|uniref:LYR motif-containing protein 2 n=1 Tax=Carassius auratus TaxID=7957 RepID=A0A6P6MZM6_CARAU|nr:LYR motif-containing protein 2 [Carassius auratus]XP_052391419.1 LYR motif-containing protein 2 [Carassius gibelio]